MKTSIKGYSHKKKKEVNITVEFDQATSDRNNRVIMQLTFGKDMYKVHVVDLSSAINSIMEHAIAVEQESLELDETQYTSLEEDENENTGP